ncbi:MAG: penicillin-binding protein 2 [Rickettsiales bacterium]
MRQSHPSMHYSVYGAAPLASLGKTRASDVDKCRRRIAFLACLCAFAFACIAVRAVQVGAFAASGAKRSPSPAAQGYGRMTVLDRGGKRVAVNLATESLYANPRKMIEKNEAARRIAAVLPSVSQEELRAAFAKDRAFVWIKRHLTPKERNDVNLLGIPGVYFQADARRIYPHNALFSHTIGYVDVDGKGLAGIERYFNDVLTHPSDPDQTMTLAQEVAVQHATRSALADAIEKYKALSGAALVTDVTTGEVLALAGLPDFDPNVPGRATEKQRFNVASLGVYEPGSVFKIFTAAMGLEEGTIHMKQKVDVTRPLRIGRYAIRDFHQSRKPFDLEEIMMESSNIGAAKIALESTADTQRTFLRSLGLFEKVSIELPERGEPLLPPEHWGKIHQATVAFGHGMAVTPLHLAKAVGAMVNGGYLKPLTLLKVEGRPPEGKRVISKDTSDKIRRLMRLTVAYGTGKNANVPHYLVGGKTGTADKAKAGGYSSNSVIASFLGVFPMNAPKYLIYVMLDDPHIDVGRPTGGRVAAPAAYEIIRRIAPVLGVPPANEDDEDVREQFWYDLDKPGHGSRA